MTHKQPPKGPTEAGRPSHVKPKVHRHRHCTSDDPIAYRWGCNTGSLPPRYGTSALLHTCAMHQLYQDEPWSDACSPALRSLSLSMLSFPSAHIHFLTPATVRSHCPSNRWLTLLRTGCQHQRLSSSWGPYITVRHLVHPKPCIPLTGTGLINMGASDWPTHGEL